MPGEGIPVNGRIDAVKDPPQPAKTGPGEVTRCADEVRRRQVRRLNQFGDHSGDVAEPSSDLRVVGQIQCRGRSGRHPHDAGS